MKSFIGWLNEAKKVPVPTTVTSAPLRGQNQDQGGIGIKHDIADYTISDETKPIKRIKEGLIAGVGATRMTPVNMSSASTTKKAVNAPSSAQSMQRQADARRKALDAVAQKQKEQQETMKNQEIQRRQQKQQSRKNGANNQ